MKAFATVFGAMLVALALAAPAQQKAASPLESKIEQRKVVRDAAGAESLVAADNVKPGDVIEYVATFRNTGKQPLARLEATLPIPANTEYLPGTARPANAKASVDGKSFGDLPLKRVVKRAGADVEESVPAREYRYLRWFPGELGGDKAVSYTARVRVLDERSPTDPGGRK